MYSLKEKKLIVSEDCEIIDAIKKINASKIKILFVINKKKN